MFRKAGKRGSVNGAAKAHSIVLEHAPAEAACGVRIFMQVSQREVVRIESEAARKAAGEIGSVRKGGDSAIALALLSVVVLLFPPS